MEDDSEIEAHLITSGWELNTKKWISVGRFLFIVCRSVRISQAPFSIDRDILIYVASLVVPHGRSSGMKMKTAFRCDTRVLHDSCGFLSYLIERRFGIPFVVSLRRADVPRFSENTIRSIFLPNHWSVFLWRQARAVIPNSVGIRTLAEKRSPGQSMQIIEMAWIR